MSASRAIQFHFYMVCCGAFDSIFISITHKTDRKRLFDLEENVSFFGTILSISSGGTTNTINCSNCGTTMVYDSNTRLITLPEGSEA
ncbi:hypothetical protein CUMW_074060 [Citrus unshiu]|nr:hypothetical protein CUMW_074060 [Citrus unshiu]